MAFSADGLIGSIKFFNCDFLRLVVFQKVLHFERELFHDDCKIARFLDKTLLNACLELNHIFVTMFFAEHDHSFLGKVFEHFLICG